MEQTNSCGGKAGSGEQMKEDERIHQRTYMNDPWMWTMMRGLPGWRGQREKTVDTTVIAPTKKYNKNK